MPAHMIPNKPKEFDPLSREGDIFRALEKLPEDYYVFHSVSETVVNEADVLFNREIDFVIVNRKKGILCLEAKAGRYINYSDRTWKYSSGKEMKRGGPYKQVESAKFTLIDKIKTHNNSAVRELFSKCKILHGVFFVDIAEVDFTNKMGLPEEADPRITLFADDLINPTRKINSIFSLELPNQKYIDAEGLMTEDEFKLLLDSVLCPHFNIIPSAKSQNVLATTKMDQLLHEQYKILEFLEEQPSAVINGAAGTGKTMLAVEKARRHSVNDENVLFLCYNRMLCDKLIETHKNNSNVAYRKQFKNVDFMTISKLAYNITGDATDYDGLNNWLYECLGDFEKFKYKHIIIDEGQDFGLVEAEIERKKAEQNCSLIDTLQLIVQENKGTFYLFYDKYQTIQGQDFTEYHLPDCITNSDCRLTLRCNCRNTNEIAKTSVTPLRDHKNKAVKFVTACCWDEPIKPKLHIIEELDECEYVLQSILRVYSKDGIDDIVILTPGVVEYSAIESNLIFNEQTGYYEYLFEDKRYKFTTCKKFKGLEAEVVVVLDLDKNSFSGKRGLEFYVGTSRAKLRLDLICKLRRDEYSEVVRIVAPNAPKTNDEERLERILSNAFSVELKQLNLV